MMEHVQAAGSKVQHLADVDERDWARHDPDDGVQYAVDIRTLCGRTIGIAHRCFENPHDCRRCRKAAEK